MKTLLAFHGKQEIKDEYVARVKAHADADEIIKGIYWEEGKGCAVGCTIEGSDHTKYEKELGIPEILAHLEDGIFEKLPNGEAKKFPLDFLEAIPVGADLSKVFAQYVIWEFEDRKYGLSAIKEVKGDKETMDVCEKVVALYKRFLNDEKIEESEWMAVEDLAYKLDWAGTWAWARAWAGTRAGIRAGTWAGIRAGTWAGAWAGTRAGTWARARAGTWAWEEFDSQMVVSKEKLLELLREAK